MADGQDEVRSRTAAAYNAAADTYDDPALSFWDRFGRRTVERLALRPGATVLDVCCGAGASAIPAAERTAPEGRVLAVDLAARLVDLARSRSRGRGIRNLEFRVADMLALELPDASFDAVVCVFGIFFTPDMAAAARELWRMVRPGGQLAITTWGKRLFEPANSTFWDAVRAERPELDRAFNPWDRISEPEALEEVLLEGGIASAEVVAEGGEHPLASPEDWWKVVLGSGYRGTVEHLDAGARARVRAAGRKALAERGIRSIEANVLYAIATKPRA